MSNSKRALVVLSGGQDSTTCLVWARRTFEEVHAITFDYNQLHSREIQAARDVAKLAGVESHEVLELGPILHGTSPLTDRTAALEQYADFEVMNKIIGDRVEKTFVPMRNALFLTIAANRAVCLDAGYIVTGVCEEDNANYPDCRKSFLMSQEGAIREALGDKFQSYNLSAPLIHRTKAQSIQMLDDWGMLYMLAFSHTSYDGQYPPLGRDHATVLRAHGFVEAGLPDPLVLRANDDSLMELPVTANYSNERINYGLIRRIRAAKDALKVLS